MEVVSNEQSDKIEIQQSKIGIIFQIEEHISICKNRLPNSRITTSYLYPFIQHTYLLFTPNELETMEDITPTTNIINAINRIETILNKLKLIIILSPELLQISYLDSLLHRCPKPFVYPNDILHFKYFWSTSFYGFLTFQDVIRCRLVSKKLCLMTNFTRYSPRSIIQIFINLSFSFLFETKF